MPEKRAPLPTVRVCPECDATTKSTICLKCGHVLESELFLTKDVEPDSLNPDAKSASTTDSLKEPKMEDSESSESLSTKPEVRSIFSDLVRDSEADSSAIFTREEKKNNGLVPLFLAILLIGLAGLSYWRFIYHVPEFISPLVLSSMSQNVDDVEIETSSVQTLELDPNLLEGNFEANNYAQFAAPDVKIFIKAFDIQSAFIKFDNEDIFARLQDQFNIDDDDLEVFFASSFGLVFPEDNFDKWGFMIEVNDNEFAESRVATFRARKENPQYEFSDYFADVVEIQTIVEVVEILEPEIPETDIDADSDPQQTAEDSDVEEVEDLEESTEDETEESPEVIEQIESRYYLLVSNNNEYLDQMRESSEGNLSNLSQELKFAQSKVGLPIVGGVSVYRDSSAQIWSSLADIVQELYQFEGLAAAIQSFTSQGIVVYERDSKTRIVGSEN